MAAHLASSSPAEAAEHLRAVFSGDHAWCGEKLRLSGELDGAVAVSSFFRDGGFAAMLERFADEKGAADRRAAASFWSLYYFSALAIPFVVARRAGWTMPVAFGEMTMVLGEDGLPAAFGLPEAGGWGDPPDSMAELVRPLVQAHLAEVVALLKEKGGIAPKLSWTNAAVYIDYAINATAGADHPADDREWPSRPLFETKSLAEGEANPFLGCLRREAVDGAVHCRRKVCCLRYMLPGIPGCGELCALPEQRHS